MAACDTIVRGDIVLPDRVLADSCLAINDGRIAAIGDCGALTARKLADASGCYIMPGVIDGQVHAGSEAGREGIAGASRAAAAGGVTTIVDMPYDDPQPVTNADLFRAKVDQLEADAYVDVALYATMARDDGLKDLEPLIEAGACAFKFSTYESHPVRFPRIRLGDMYEAFSIVAPTGLACGIHNENQEIVDKLQARYRSENPGDPGIHALSRPPAAECVAIAEVYELGAATGCRAHIVHCSVSRGFDLCAAYKSQGIPVSIETCIHYLTLNEDEVAVQGARAKINPPLRPQREVDLLWEHIRAGNVDFVSTDHVAWSLSRKSNRDFVKNASGVPGIEELVPLFYTELLRRDIDITVMAHLLCEGPARHFLLYPQKGVLRVGADADLMILEKSEFTVDPAKTQTAAEWSPYAGRKLTGRVKATYVRGVEVWNGETVCVERSFGQFRRPNLVGAAAHAS